MKNFFCVGQKVIERHTRNIHTITDIYPNGKVLLDNFLVLDPEYVQEQEEYLDPTSYFYHHSLWGNAVTQGNFWISDLLFWLDTIQEAKVICKGEGRDRFISKAEQNVKEAEKNLEHWLTIKRTAEHNLSQWSNGKVRHVMAQHMPFLNPENCSDYFKE